MAEIKLFQLCYEGDLTVEVSEAIRKLGAEPTFDQSWQIWLPHDRHAAPLLRYLRGHIGADARLLVAQANFSLARDFLLVRHSLTPDGDYRELYDAIRRLGAVIDLPFESTFVVRSSDRSDVQSIGEHLGQLCPDDALMVIGISHDFAYTSAGESRMFVGAEPAARRWQFRTF
jgi:hypothetical protein